MSWTLAKKAIERLRTVQMEFSLPAKYLDWGDRVKPDTLIYVSGNIIIASETDPITQQIKVVMNSTFVPLLDDIHTHYTWLFLEDLACIRRSEYGARIYQWLRMHKPSQGDFCDFTWYIDGDSEKEPSIRRFLGVPESKYARTRDFYRYIVAVTFEKLNDCLSHRFHIEYEPCFRKGGRGQAIIGVKINRVAWKESRKKPLSRPNSADILDGNAVDRTEATEIAQKAITYVNSIHHTAFILDENAVNAVASYMLDGMDETEILAAVHHYLMSNCRPDQAAWRTPAKIFAAKDFRQLGQIPVTTIYGKYPWETGGPDKTNAAKNEPAVRAAYLLDLCRTDIALLKLGRRDVAYKKDRQNVLDFIASTGDTSLMANVLPELRTIDDEMEMAQATTHPTKSPEREAPVPDDEDDFPF